METPTPRNLPIAAALSEASAIRFHSLGEPSPEEACVIQAAIHNARAVIQLQQAYRQTGFRALPLHDYLQGLASNVGVQLPIKESTDSSTAAQMSPWIDLAQQMEVAARHLQLWVRAWFAILFQAPETAMVRARSHSVKSRRNQAAAWSTGASEDDLEALLTAAERAYTQLQMAELHNSLAVLP